MNFLRKLGLWAGIACAAVAVITALTSFLAAEGTADYETTAFLFTAAIMFAAPYLIIPARKPSGEADRINDWGEVVASGYYAVTILLVIYLGFPYLQAFFEGVGSTQAGSQGSLPQIVFLVAFAVNLFMHALSFVTASLRLASGKASA